MTCAVLLAATAALSFVVGGIACGIAAASMGMLSGEAAQEMLWGGDDG